jgi:septin family protein
MTKTTFTVVATGQPGTGKTSTLRNLFASIAQDPAWVSPSPANASDLLFSSTFEEAETELDVVDEEQRLAVKYRIIVRACKLVMALRIVWAPSS